MQRLILHVGMHKTGTNAIQRSLAREPGVLAAHGLGYVRLDRSNHSFPVRSLFSDEPEVLVGHRRQGRLAAAAVAAFDARTRATLEQELGNPRAPTMIISGEGIGLLTEPETARMLAFLGRFADEIRVIAFVRPPVSFLASNFQELTKSGLRYDRLEKVQIRYRRTLEKYARLLPPGALDLRLSHRSALPGGCSLRAFLAACGVPPSALDRLPATSANRSLTQPAVQWLLALNELFPNRPDGRFHPLRPRGVLRAARRIGGPRFRLPGELAEEILAREAGEVDWANRMLGCDLRAFDVPVDRTMTMASLASLARRDRSLRAALGLSAL